VRGKPVTTVHQSNGNFLYAVKGAPGAVIERSHLPADTQPEPMTAELRATWNAKARDLAGQGLRVLVLADKDEDSSDADLPGRFAAGQGPVHPG
jgi:P-type Ca2+ transporter type 2C